MSQRNEMPYLGEGGWQSLRLISIFLQETAKEKSNGGSSLYPLHIKWWVSYSNVSFSIWNCTNTILSTPILAFEMFANILSLKGGLCKRFPNLNIMKLMLYSYFHNSCTCILCVCSYICICICIVYVVIFVFVFGKLT